MPHENDSGGRGPGANWKFQWPDELAELVRKRFGCLFGPFGYGPDPNDKKPQKQMNTVSADEVHRCRTAVPDLGLFKLRVENKDERNVDVLERYQLTSDHSKEGKTHQDFKRL